MRRKDFGMWSWYLAAVLISALGVAGCGGGGGGGGGGGIVPPTSPFTKIGGNNNSGDTGVVLSQTGRYVAFSSLASDLTGAGNDTNPSYDVFVFDRQTGDYDGRQQDRRDLQPEGGERGRLQLLPGESVPTGAMVAFESRAANLIGPADPADTSSDIFVARQGLQHHGTRERGRGRRSPGRGQLQAFHQLRRRFRRVLFARHEPCRVGQQRGRRRVPLRRCGQARRRE